MTRYFSLEEAQQLVPTVLAIADELLPVRAELALRMHERREGGGGLAEIKALEARVSDLLDRLTSEGIQVKGYAPLLVDLPHRAGDRELLLCWLEGERELDWYHDAALGFMGRRRLDELR